MRYTSLPTPGKRSKKQATGNPPLLMLYLQHQNGSDKKESHRIGDDHGQVMHQNAVKEPQDDADHQQNIGGQRQVLGVPGFDGLERLRDEGDRGAGSCDEAEDSGCGEYHGMY